MVPVTKKLGAVRWCVDQVNKVTVTDSYPTPNISIILDLLSLSKKFSTLDAAQAYHAIPIEEKSCSLTAFATAFGLWQFAHMRFGLKNARRGYCHLVQLG